MGSGGMCMGSGGIHKGSGGAVFCLRAFFLRAGSSRLCGFSRMPRLGV